MDAEIGDLEPPRTVSLAASSENGLSVNGLLLNSPYLGRLRTTSLGVVRGKESLNGLDLRIFFEGSGDLADSPEGRTLLKYVATCALPPETELVVAAEGTEHVFRGHLGLAPEWATGTCDAECEGWVSACLLAHANARGENVHISLRGDHESLAPTSLESTEYAFEEGAFYGNLFVAEPVLFACTGEGSFDRPTDSSDSLDRLCSRGLCGVKNVGPCNHERFHFSACTSVGPYAECTSDIFNGQPYDEVITVMLRRDRAD